MRVVLLLSVLASGLLLGCASHGSRQAATSGLIGCPTSEIEVSEGDIGWSTNTWTARCRGKTIYCTFKQGEGTSCTEEVASETP